MVKGYGVLLIGFFLISSPLAGFADEFSFAPEVESVLSKKGAMLQEIASSPLVISAIRSSNLANAFLSFKAIKELDRKWVRASVQNSFIRPFLTSECAGLLSAFRDKHKEFVEVFITDARGLLVAATNKISDFYQADEDWWVTAFRNKAGKGVFHGQVEYDESSGSQSIAFYLTVIDPGGGNPLGVIKAVCDLDAIIAEL